MANAIKFFKMQIGQTRGLELTDARQALIDAVDAFVHERIQLADTVIAQHAARKIVNGDVVLTYADADCTEAAFAEAHKNGTRFRVVVVDTSKREAVGLLRRLVRRGIECDYVLLSGASYKMAEVTKAMLGADAMMSNGAMLARAGSAALALLAHAAKVPVIALCETYKFCERVQLDSITVNELLDPDTVLPAGADADPIRDWRNTPNLTLLALRYDIAPSYLLDACATDVGLLPTTSISVVLREFAHKESSGRR